MNPIANIFPRLRWACRRGMLELDVLLGNFLEEAFVRLPATEQNTFIELLNNQDPDLFMWLTGKSAPLSMESAMLVEKIRYHAQHRNKNTTL